MLRLKHTVYSQYGKDIKKVSMFILVYSLFFNPVLYSRHTTKYELRHRLTAKAEQSA